MQTFSDSFYGAAVIWFSRGDTMKLKKETLAQAVLLALLCLSACRQNIPAAENAIPEPAPKIVSVRQKDGIVQMDLERYIQGVVLAEMPAYFEPEALKAQAVAARTFAWKAVCTGGKHGDGSICTDAACCQGYLAPGQYLQAYGTAQDLEKISAAVQDTRQMVITYGGEPIEATYFSSSSGYTEDAAAVWGSPYPYLISQESPEQQTSTTTAFSRAKLEEILGVQLDEPPENWFTAWTYTPGRGVNTVKIGRRVFTGTQLRALLKLRSTAFSVEIQNDAVLITAAGFGHRVGMSQYGADAMAAQGSSFLEILSYYYPGTEVTAIP